MLFLLVLASGFEFDPVSDFYPESEFELESGSDFLGVVPFDVDFLESNCTNHVAGSTYTITFPSDLQTHHKIKRIFVLKSFFVWLNSNAKSENH